MPPFRGLPAQSGGQISALLQIVPSSGDGRVDFRNIQVLKYVPGIFRPHEQGQIGSQFLLSAGLDGQVPVALAVVGEGIPVGLLVNGSGDAPVGIVPGYAGVVPAAFGRIEHMRIGPELREVAVLPHHHRVVTLVTFRRVPEVLDMEWIAPMGMCKTCLNTGGKDGRPAGFPGGGRGYGSEGSAPQPHLESVAAFRRGQGAGQVQGAGATVFPGRLQEPGALALKEFRFFQPFGGNPPQVHLRVLCIVDGHAVQEHGCMRAAQAPDVDGLEPARAAVVAQLQAAEFAYGRRQVLRRAEPFGVCRGRWRSDFQGGRYPCGTK